MCFKKKKKKEEPSEEEAVLWRRANVFIHRRKTR